MAPRIRFVMNCEYPANSVFTQVQPERQVDLLSDAGTAISAISLLHFNNGINDFFGWTFWTSLLPATW